jgi:uncharacterized membrane protein YdbT with pleckstrin-like domain
MGYIENNLVPNETIVLRGKLHRLVLVMPPLMLVGTVIALLVCVGIVFSGLGDLWKLLAGAASFFLIFCVFGAIVGAVQAYLNYFFGNEIAVTSRRLILKLGVIRREHMEFTFRQIESIAFDQSLLDRLVGGAQLKVLGAGSGWVRSPYLSNFQEFRQAALQQIEAAHGAGEEREPAPKAPAPVSPISSAAGAAAAGKKMARP